MTEAVLADWRTAAIDEKPRAALGLLEKLTLAPGDVTADDLRRVRAAGVRPDAIADVIYVCALLNLIDRVSDALGFHVPPAESLSRTAAVLYERGYK